MPVPGSSARCASVRRRRPHAVLSPLLFVGALLLLLLLLVEPAGGATSPTRRLFHVSSTKFTNASDAFAYCTSRSLVPVSLLSTDENAELQALATAESATGVWLGAQGPAFTTWLQGITIGTDFWASGEPAGVFSQAVLEVASGEWVTISNDVNNTLAAGCVVLGCDNSSAFDPNNATDDVCIAQLCSGVQFRDQPGSSSAEFCKAVPNLTGGLAEPCRRTAPVCLPLTDCTGTEFETTPATSTADRACTPLTNCTSAEFESTPATATSDRACTPLTNCTEIEFAFTPATPTSDRVCFNRTDCALIEFEQAPATASSDAVCIEFTNCTSTEYASTVATPTSDRACSPLTPCTATQFESATPTPTADRECTFLANCTGTEFEQTPATSTSDRVCTALRTCSGTEFESTAPTATSDRACTPLTNCAGSEFESTPATTTSNRACSPLTTCTGIQFETTPATSTADRACTPLTNCTSAEFESTPATTTSDRACSPLTTCTDIQFETTPATSTADRACTPLTNCTSAEFESTPATTTSDRACSPLTTCTGAEFESTPATATSDRACTPLTNCTEIEFAFTPATPTSDRVCFNRTDCALIEFEQAPATASSDAVCIEFTNCTSTEYASTVATPTSDRACSPLTPCTATQFESATPTPTADRECTFLANCTGTEFEQTPATSTSDRVCTALRTCSGTEFESTAPTATSDRACTPLTNCAGSEFESTPATTTSDRACSPLTTCTGIQFETTPATSTADRACSPLTDCTGSQFETTAATSTSDRACADITTCIGALEFEQQPPTTTSDRVCQTLTNCTTAQFESLAETPTTDRVCTDYTHCFHPAFSAVNDDWVGDAVSGFVYLAVTEPKAWQDAEVFCAAEGGHLVSFENVAEHAVLRSQVLPGVSRWWIGLNDIAAETSFVWTDGSASSQAELVANNFLASDCVASASTTLFEDLPCATPLPFICKKPALSDWVYRLGSMYLFGSEAVGHGVAKQRCEAMGAHLVHIETEQEHNAILNAKPDSLVAWIGYDGNTVSWDDGSPLEFINFLPETPLDCAIIKQSTGLWRYLACSTNRAYICEREVNGDEFVQAPELAGSTKYIPFTRQPEPGSAVSTTCATVGATPLRIESAEEQAAIAGFLLTSTTVWLDIGTYDNYASSNPEAGELCTYLDLSDGLWYSADCSDSATVVCERPEEFVTFEGGPTNDFSCGLATPSCGGSEFEAVPLDRTSDRTCQSCGNCSPGEYAAQDCNAGRDRVCSACPAGTFAELGNQVVCQNWTSCDYAIDWRVQGNFKYHASSHQMRFEQAQTYCSDLGGSHLISISDTVEWAFVVGLSQGESWAGLIPDGVGWQWEDGSSSASFLDSNLPPSPAAGVCNTLNEATPSFNQASCDTVQFAVCKDDFEIGEWVRSGNYEYLKTADRVEYSVAETTCGMHGGFVATIGSEAERNIVIEVSGSSSNDLWLGLSDELEEGNWLWSDGRLTSYFPFDLNRPVFGGEDCAVQLNNFGSFQDTACGQQKRFVCQRDISAESLEICDPRSEFQIAEGSATSNRVCSPLTECTIWVFQQPNCTHDALCGADCGTCVAGTFIKEACGLAPSVCEACPAESFSGTDNLTACTPWAECGVNETATVCHHIPAPVGPQTFTCPGSLVFTSIDFASFGTPTGTCAGTDYAVDPACHDPESRLVVLTKCLGESTCALSAADFSAPDTCGAFDPTLLLSLNCTDPLLFEDQPPTITSDRTCGVCTICGVGSFVVSNCTATDDTVCSPCAASTFSKFASQDACQAVATCSPLEFETVAPSPSNDRECQLTTVCTADEFETVATTLTSDRVCNPLHPCEFDERVVSTPTLTSDWVCAPLAGTINAALFENYRAVGAFPAAGSTLDVRDASDTGFWTTFQSSVLTPPLNANASIFQPLLFQNPGLFSPDQPFPGLSDQPLPISANGDPLEFEMYARTGPPLGAQPAVVVRWVTDVAVPVPVNAIASIRAPAHLNGRSVAVSCGGVPQVAQFMAAAAAISTPCCATPGSYVDFAIGADEGAGNSVFFAELSVRTSSNLPPVVEAPASVHISASTPVGTPVMDFNATAECGLPVTFAIDTAGAPFAIDAEGVIRVTGNVSAQSTWGLTVRVSDGRAQCITEAAVVPGPCVSFLNVTVFTAFFECTGSVLRADGSALEVAWEDPVLVSDFDTGLARSHTSPFTFPVGTTVVQYAWSGASPAGAEIACSFEVIVMRGVEAQSTGSVGHLYIADGTDSASLDFLADEAQIHGGGLTFPILGGDLSGELVSFGIKAPAGELFRYDIRQDTEAQFHVAIRWCVSGEFDDGEATVPATTEIVIVGSSIPSVSLPGSRATPDGRCFQMAARTAAIPAALEFDSLYVTFRLDSVAPNGPPANASSLDLYEAVLPSSVFGALTATAAAALTGTPAALQADPGPLIGVEDIEPPVLVVPCPPDLSLKAAPSATGTVVSWTEPSFVDNVQLNRVERTHAPGDFFTLLASPHLVTYTGVDTRGLSTSCSFLVAVDYDSLDLEVNSTVVFSDIAAFEDPNYDVTPFFASSLFGDLLIHGASPVPSFTANLVAAGLTGFELLVLPPSGDKFALSLRGADIRLANIEIDLVFAKAGADVDSSLAALDPDVFTTIDLLGYHLLDESDRPLPLPTNFFTSGPLSGVSLAPGREYIRLQGTSGELTTETGFTGFRAKLNFPKGLAGQPASEVLYQLRAESFIRFSYYYRDAAPYAGGEQRRQFLLYFDAEPPTFDGCPADLVAVLPNGSSTANVSWTPPVAQDNKLVTATSSSHAPGAAFAITDAVTLPTTVTYEAQDAFGNVGTCTFTVTVLDQEAPELACPAALVFPTQPGANFGIVPWDEVGLNATDNSGFFDFPVVQAQFVVGQYMAVALAEDRSGNIGTCTVNLTIADGEAPVFSGCPNFNELIAGADSSDGAVVIFDEPTALDNHLVDRIVSSHRSGDLFPLGSTEVTMTALDASGNAVSCVFEVQVLDKIVAGSQAALSTTMLGSIGLGASLLVLVLLVMAVRFRQQRSRPHDFNELMEELMKIQGLAASGDGVVTPREIKRSAVKQLTVIGKGNFGEVTKGLVNEGNGIPDYLVAIKVHLGAAAGRDELLQESAIMAQFKHPNIVGLVGVVTAGDPLLVVLEFCEHGSLNSYLQKYETNEADKVQMAAEAAAGMAYLCSRGFVHRDLAARNVLVSSDKSCKISDFGLSRDTEDSEYYQSKGGALPVRWTSVEALELRKFSPASDVWSYGILLYEIWTKAAMPYKGWGNQKVWSMVTGGYRLGCPEGCSKAMHAIMLKCWEAEPRDRPEFADLHEFFEARVQTNLASRLMTTIPKAVWDEDRQNGLYAPPSDQLALGAPYAPPSSTGSSLYPMAQSDCGGSVSYDVTTSDPYEMPTPSDAGADRAPGLLYDEPSVAAPEDLDNYLTPSMCGPGGVGAPPAAQRSVTPAPPEGPASPSSPAANPATSFKPLTFEAAARKSSILTEKSGSRRYSGQRKPPRASNLYTSDWYNPSDPSGSSACSSPIAVGAIMPERNPADTLRRSEAPPAPRAPRPTIHKKPDGFTPPPTDKFSPPPTLRRQDTAGIEAAAGVGQGSQPLRGEDGEYRQSFDGNWTYRLSSDLKPLPKKHSPSAWYEAKSQEEVFALDQLSDAPNETGL